MAKSVRKKSKIASASKKVGAGTYAVTIRTNGTIDGVGVKEKTYNIPSGTKFAITENTIVFGDGSKYCNFIVQSSSNTKNFTVKSNSTSSEYKYFNSLNSGISVDINVIKPEDGEQVKFEEIANWYLDSKIVTEGTVTKDITINATFDTAPIYEVTIVTNGIEGIVKVPIRNKIYETIVDNSGTIVDNENTKASYSIEYTTYSTSGCIITFSDGQKVELHKPEDTEYAKYDSDPTWTPSSGTITDNLIINAFFANTLKDYDITISTNGTISGESEGTKTKTIQAKYGDTYQVTGDTITFSNGTSITVVKPDDDYEKEIYGTEISWSPNYSGTISDNLDFVATFVSTPVYEVSVQRDADGEKTNVEKIHVLKGATYSTFYLEKINYITFYGQIYIYNTKDKKYDINSTYTISIKKPEDNDRHKYYDEVNWYSSSGTNDTINSNTTISASFSFIYKYKVAIVTNKINGESSTIIKTEEKYIFSNARYTVENNTIIFTYNEKTIDTVTVIKPDDNKQWEYLSDSEWNPIYGTITEDTTINANFIGTLVNYKVSITTNGLFSEDESKKIEFNIPYGTKYSSNENTIIFYNDRNANIIKELSVIKPDDDNEHKYNTNATWVPASGEVTDVEKSRIINAEFGYTPKYLVTVKTNGTIKDSTANSKELHILEGTKYTVTYLEEDNSNYIIFYDEDGTQMVYIIKPNDDIQTVYKLKVTWTYLKDGTAEEWDPIPKEDERIISKDIIFNGEFASGPHYYDVDVKTNGTFNDGYHEIILSLPYGTKYETYAQTSGEVTNNGINFIYNDKIIETRELERPDFSYTYNVAWEPKNSGFIIGNTEETILKNITGNFELKKSNDGEVIIFDKYTIDEGYVKMDETGKIVIDEDTMPYGYKARIMKLSVSSYYVGDVTPKTHVENFLVRWNLSVCDRLYTYTIDEEGEKNYNHIDSMPEDGDWYTTGPTIVKIDGKQRYFHVETGTTQGDFEGLNVFPSLPGYIEGEFYKEGDAEDVCDSIDYSLITFIGNYSREERNAITTQILLDDPDNPTYNYKYGSLERYYPEEFEKSRTITIATNDEKIIDVNFTIPSISEKSHKFNYGDSAKIEATLKDEAYLFSCWEVKNNEDKVINVYYENPLTISNITETLTYTACATKVYGIKKNINVDNSIWERTNASVGLIAQATHDGTFDDVKNDFDSIYPWSDIVSVNIDKNTITATYSEDTYGKEGDKFRFDGSNGDVMTYIPKHYARRYLDNGNECIQISKNPFIGATEIKSFYYSRYPMSEDYMSKSKTFGQVNKTIDEFRDIISTNKGDEWSQLDWRLFIIKNLYLVEYASGESQEILGKGVSAFPLRGFILGFSRLKLEALGIENGMFKHFEPWVKWDDNHKTLKPYVYKEITYQTMGKVEVTHIVRVPPDAKSYQVSNGECDALGMHSGCLVNDGYNSVIYRGIENPFGNIWCFVDGINIKSFKTFVCTDPTKYKNNCYRTPYKKLGYISSYGEGSPTENGYDSSYPLISIPTSTTSTHTNGYYWREMGERILISGGHWYVNTLGEIFNLSANYTPRVSRFDIGTRLLRSSDNIKVKSDEE